MNGGHQIFIFAACMLAGVLAGPLYEIFSLFCFFVKNKAARIAADILFFALAG